MRTKRIVSSIAALTMAASVFAGLAVTASAEGQETLVPVYSNDFESTSDFTQGGRSDGIIYNPGTTVANTKGSQIIGIGSASGDANLQSPSFSTMQGYENASVLKVSFEFKIDACTSGKSSNIALIGGSNTSSWLNSDQQILTISAPTSGNGYFSEITINGKNITDKLKETEATADIGGLNRDSTGWVKVDATISFEDQEVSYTLTKSSSVVDSGTVSFVNADVNQLDRLFIAAGKGYGGVCVDNVSVSKVVTETPEPEKEYVSAKVSKSTDSSGLFIGDEGEEFPSAAVITGKVDATNLAEGGKYTWVVNVKDSDNNDNLFAKEFTATTTISGQSDVVFGLVVYNFEEAGLNNVSADNVEARLYLKGLDEITDSTQPIE